MSKEKNGGRREESKMEGRAGPQPGPTEKRVNDLWFKETIPK